NGRLRRRRPGPSPDPADPLEERTSFAVHPETSRSKYHAPGRRPMSKAPWEVHEGEAFRRVLVEYKMANHPFKTHPFFAHLERGEVPRDVLERWVTQFYPWLACVPLAMAERFARC